MKNEINKSEPASHLRSVMGVNKDPKIKAGLGSLVRLPLQVQSKKSTGDTVQW